MNYTSFVSIDGTCSGTEGRDGFYLDGSRK